MRSLALSLVLFAFVASCGDDGTGGDDDVAYDASASAADADPNAPDADPNAPDADPSAPDAASSGGGDGVACGDVTCTDPEVCCVTGGMGGGSAACTAADACMGVPITCDGPEDCDGGDVCCGNFGGGGGSADCAPADGCTAVVCHETADCPNPGDTCCDLGFGSSICSSFCPGG